MTFNPKNIDLT